MAKTELAKMLPIVLGLLLQLSLSFTPVSPAIAAPDEVKWSRVNIPSEGKRGNWVLASGSDVRHLTMAIDGTLYAYANPSGTSYTLFKSTDSGYSWSYTGEVKNAIVDIATAPDDASTIYYATPSKVYRSTDAGNTFLLLPPNPGGAGSNNIEITSIDVAYLGYRIILVGTRDTDSGQYGGIYTLDERMPITWTDTNLANYDVYAVAFPPNFPAEHQLVAVVTDETDTLVTTKVGDAAWGATIGDVKIVGVTPTSADIAFSDDYGIPFGHYGLFVAIDTGSGNGDVYRISGTRATDLNIGSTYGLGNIDVTTVAVTGNAATANLLAGAAASAQVYFSTDGGINWTRSTKEPTGQSKTYVLMAPDFNGHSRAYAATSGTESAFSYTTDGCITWNQIGLIDTSLSTILDFAPSPNYSQDETLFMLTWGGKHSLWGSLSGGARWERLYSSTVAAVGSISQVELSPQYGNGSQVVFIAGTSGGNPAIWKSTDNGQNFTPPRVTHDPITGAIFPIDTWAVVNDNTLFIGSYDGSNGLVYHTTNSGWFYSTRGVAGSQSLNSIALSPDYEQDETILVGNTNGWVYWSNNNGVSFEPLPLDATSPPLAGSVTIAFDPRYSSNHTVYAASNTPDKGIYRFIIGTRTNWESIDSTLPSGGMVSQLVVSTDGTLYATNFKANGGMERCLNPTYPLGPKFETVTRGLDTGATLSGLWLCDHRLWAIDTTNNRLITFNDSLAQPITLTSPLDQAPGIGMIVNYTIRNVSLDWEVLPGATSYTWQLNYETSFSSIPAGFEGNTEASSAKLPLLEPATRYYWRVRATEPVLSPWSAKWSFTTSLGTETIAPKLSSPEAGASGVPIKPLFQWSAVAGADTYELLVSTNVSFANPSILKIGAYALPTTAWQCDTSLDYNTTYYWKVRAISADTYSAWSAVSVFTTEALPSPPPPPSAQPATPSWSKWLTHLGAGLLLIMIAMLIALIILTVKVLRL